MQAVRLFVWASLIIITGCSLAVASVDEGQDLSTKHAITDEQCNAIMNSLKDQAELTLSILKIQIKIAQITGKNARPDGIDADLQHLFSIIKQNKHDQLTSLYAFKSACQSPSK